MWVFILIGVIFAVCGTLVLKDAIKEGETTLKLFSVFLLMLGVLSVYAGVDVKKSAVDRESNTNSTNQMVIEKVKEETGEDEVTINTTKSGKVYILDVGEDLYEVKVYNGVMEYRKIENTIKFKN